MKVAPAPDSGAAWLTACGHHSRRHHRRRRHVVGRRSAAGSASRFWRAAGRSVVGVYAHHGRWRDRRCGASGACSTAPAFVPVLLVGAVFLAVGYVGAAYAGSFIAYALAQVVIGFGSSIALGPLMADISHWFVRRRGVAVTLTSAGNYVAGTVWSPVVQHLIASVGWRSTHAGIGIASGAAIVLIGLIAMRGRAPDARTVANAVAGDSATGALGLSFFSLQVLLCVASVCCCVAMSMPQVHIVAYCGDLGYGVAHGADMLAVMMAAGIVSRIGSGFIADRVGGLRTLLLGSVLQGTALALYLFYNGLVSLYVVSALFGLFQGGIVPSYAIIVREYFPPQQAGARVGVVLMTSMFGMALGGWLSGLIFDLTGSYAAAFLNGLGFNAVNGTIVLWLLYRRHSSMAYA